MNTSRSQQQRLAAALRENLKRRKAQARARNAEETDRAAPPDGENGPETRPKPDFRRNPSRE